MASESHASAASVSATSGFAQADVLQQASLRLSRASTPAEVLQVLAEPALQSQASYTALYTFTLEEQDQQDQPQWATLQSHQPPTQTHPFGQRFYLPDFPFTSAWFEATAPTAFEYQIEQTDTLAPTLHLVLETQDLQTAIFIPLTLPLNSSKPGHADSPAGQRWVGLAVLMWAEPFSLPADQQTYYRQMAPISALVLDNQSLLAETYRRTENLERLSNLQADLSRTQNEEEILQVLYAALDENEGVTIALAYTNALHDEKPDMLLPVAVAKDGKFSTDDSLWYRRTKLKYFPLIASCLDAPNKILFVPTVKTDPRASENLLALAEAGDFTSLAVIPLRSSERWQGLVALTWREQHQFSPAETFILQRLLEPLAATVTSRRAELAQQTALAETEILYLASAELNTAQNYDNILKVLKRYTVLNQASLVSLNYFAQAWPSDVWQSLVSEDSASRPTLPAISLLAGELTFTSAETTAAETTAGETSATETPAAESQIDLRYTFAQAPVLHHILDPHVPLVIDQETPDSSVDDPEWLAFAEAYQLQALITVPLLVGSSWVGFIAAGFTSELSLMDTELRRLNALVGQSAVVVQNLQTLTLVEQRANQLETLSEIQRVLSQATDEADIVDAISLGFAPAEGLSLLLFYAENDAEGQPETGRTVSIWQNGTARQIEAGEYEFFKLITFALADVWLDSPNEAIFFENIQQDARVDETSRALSDALGFRAMSIVPLRSGGRWLGTLTLTWASPHSFPAIERATITQLVEPCSAVVATRRAALDEQAAREENERLYQVSRIINEAVDLQEIVAAVTEGLPLPNVHRALLLTFTRYSTSDSISATVVANWHSGDGPAPAEVDTHFGQGDFEIEDFKLAEDPLFITDVSHTKLLEASTRQFLSERDVQAVALFPLNVGALALGTFALFSNTRHHFTEREVGPHLSVMPQVAVAVDNKRLFNQTKDRTVRLQAASRIGQDLAAVLNLDELLQRAVSALHDTLGYYAVQIYLLNEAGTELVFHEGSGPAREALKEEGHRIDLDAERSLVARAAYAVEPIFSPDVRQDENFNPHPLLPDTRSEVALPISLNEELIGVLNAQDDKVGLFDSDEVRTLLIIANQLAVNITNARLFVRTQTSLQETEALYEVGAKLSPANDMDDILLAVLDSPLTTTAKQANLYLFEHDSAGEPVEAVIEATYSKEEDSDAPRLLGQRVTLAEQILTEHWLHKHNMVLLIDDVLKDPRVDENTRAQAKTFNIRASALLPLTIFRRHLGMVVLNWEKVHHFTDDEHRFFNALATQVALVVDRIVLFTQTQNRAEELAKLSQIQSNLSQAVTEAEILQAICQPLNLPPGAQASLGLVEVDAQNQPVTATEVATWQNGRLLGDSPLLNQTLELADMPTIQLMTDTPDKNLVIENVNQAQNLDAETRRLITENGLLALILLPLRTAGRWQGFLSIGWPEPREFLPQELDMYAQFRESVAAVLSSRRAYLAQQEARAESERRAKQLSTLQDITAAVNATDRLHDNLLALNENMNKLVPVDIVTLSTYTPGSSEILLINPPVPGADEDEAKAGFQDFYDRTVRLPLQGSCPGWVIENKQIWLENDIAENKKFIEDENLLQLDMHARLILPLHLGDLIIGTLNLASQQVGAFSVADLPSLRQVADQVASALSRSQLFEQTQRQVYREQAIRQITERMRSADNLADLVEITAVELGQHLSAKHVIVDLGLNSELEADSTEDKTASTNGTNL